VGLDFVEDTGKVTLISKKDKKSFECNKKYIFMSTLIKTALEGGDTELELNVDGATLGRAIEYMNHHEGVLIGTTEEERHPATPMFSNVMSDVCKDKWDATFADKIGDESVFHLYDLLNAASYLDILPLVWLMQAKVASLIKGQKVEHVPLILRGEMKPEKVKLKGNYFEQQPDYEGRLPGEEGYDLHRLNC